MLRLVSEYFHSPNALTTHVRRCLRRIPFLSLTGGQPRLQVCHEAGQGPVAANPPLALGMNTNIMNKEADRLVWVDLEVSCTSKLLLMLLVLLDAYSLFFFFFFVTLHRSTVNISNRHPAVSKMTGTFNADRKQCLSSPPPHALHLLFLRGGGTSQ